MILIILLSEQRNWKLIVLGVIWFLAFLIPTFYHYLGHDTLPKFYEHRIYLPFMGILLILLSLSFTHRLRFFKRFFPLILFFVFIYLGWLSYTRTFNFKNSLTLSEYDVISSPNEPRRYSDITRMSIPEELDQEIKAVQSKSQLLESDRAQVSKENLCKIIDNLKDKLNSDPHNSDLLHAFAVACFSRGLFLSSEENFLMQSR